MIRQGESRASFSTRLKISPASLQRYEAGQRLPDKDFLDRLIADKKIIQRWLLTGEGPMYQQEGLGTELPPKTCDMSQVSTDKTTQHIENTVLEKNQTCDMSQVLAFQRELLETVRQNGDLRVEIERLRMDVERRDARIAELERQLAEALKAPQSRQNLLDTGRAAAG